MDGLRNLWSVTNVERASLMSKGRIKPRMDVNALRSSNRSSLRPVTVSSPAPPMSSKFTSWPMGARPAQSSARTYTLDPGEYGRLLIGGAHLKCEQS